MIQLLVWLYVSALSVMAVYGLLGLYTAWQYWRHRQETFPTPQASPGALPRVTIQLPLYNERYVVKRVIQAAVSLDYPRHLLQIQVVDDSSDDTAARAGILVESYRRQGIDISLIRRIDRNGYKAGALGNALAKATGDYIAVFDADFAPNRDFLQQTIPHFLTRPRLGMVQARWAHLNPDAAPLTAAQAIALDKHFAMEQVVRHRANLFPKFNGAAGVWRRETIVDAGGWLDDTVCEDLCLSTRAILKQWEFLFLNDVTAPAELPTSILAYKNQQARWAKGSMQCLLKYGRGILQDSHHTLAARLYALLSMSAYLTHVLLLVMLLVQGLLAFFNHPLPGWLLYFGLAGIGQPILFVLAQRVLYANWQHRLRHLPTMLLVAIGLAPSTARAMAELLFKQRHPFVRTPKGNDQDAATGQNAAAYWLPFDRLIMVEIALALYAGSALLAALWHANWGPISFLLTCTLGYSYVAYLGLCESHHTRKRLAVHLDPLKQTH